MVKYYDYGHNHSPEYIVGNQVWLNLGNYPSTYPSKKLDDKWARPFRIMKIISPNVIKLVLSGHVCGIHPVMPVASVWHFATDVIDGHMIPPLPKPIIVDGHDEMEIERILDCKTRYK